MGTTHFKFMTRIDLRRKSPSFTSRQHSTNPSNETLIFGDSETYTEEKVCGNSNKNPAFNKPAHMYIIYLTNISHIFFCFAFDFIKHSLTQLPIYTQDLFEDAPTFA